MHEPPLIGLGKLAKIPFQGGDLSAVRDDLIARIGRNESDANALLDLSTVMQLTGNREYGLALQNMGLELTRVFHLAPADGRREAIRLLSISRPGDLAENNALEFVVDGSDIALDTLYVTPGVPVTIPDHDVAMVAICESDRNRPVLGYVEELIRHWPKPVLCAPSKIAALARDSASSLLGEFPGGCMPPNYRVGREGVAGPFPIVARPVDTHKGQGLKRLNSEAEAAEYLASRTEDEFYVARYVDFSSGDGQFRKYRVMFIGGRPYVCHMAISSNWIVHYASAGMVENPVKRAEEQACFETFDQAFARRHQVAFEAICERVRLPYFGIDCAELRDGRLLVFEADSGMTIHAMDPVELFPYKQPQMRKVFAAFRELLLETRRAAALVPGALAARSH